MAEKAGKPEGWMESNRGTVRIENGDKLRGAEKSKEKSGEI